MITEISTSPQPRTINKIIGVEDQEIDEIAKSRVQQKLAEDAEILLEKKKREQEKKERVRRMQENFERQRAKKLQQITEKSLRSSLAKERNKEDLVKKFKQKSDHYKSVLNKIEHQNEVQIEKALRQQEELNHARTHSLSKSFKEHKHHSKTDALPDVSPDIDLKMLQITEKARRAREHHDEQQRNVINRMKKMSKHIEEAQKRAHQLSHREQAQALSSYYERSREMQKISGRTKSMNQKKLIERRKSFKQKIDKCNENLRHISYQQEEKFQEMQKKFDRQYSPKSWKDHRLQKYKQKWQQNTKILEQEKEEKAEQILLKHQQITQQNKTYKEKRDKLLQAVKHIQV